MMNPQTVEDLLDHASEQIAAVVGRTFGLFDDENEGFLFLTTLMGRHLVQLCRLMHGDESETDAEALLTTAIILAIQIDRRKLRVEDINQQRAGRRAAALLKKIRAAAGAFPG
jgi:hypothetical protein